MVNPFVFRNGETATTVGGLISLCVRFPEDALYHFINGHFEPWLNYIGASNIAELATQTRDGATSPEECLNDFIKAVKVAAMETTAGKIAQPSVGDAEAQDGGESPAEPVVEEKHAAIQEEKAEDGEAPSDKVESARWGCPECGNNDRRMIREETDKSIMLNAYPPVYGKKLVCGQCGAEWHHK